MNYNELLLAAEVLKRADLLKNSAYQAFLKTNPADPKNFREGQPDDEFIDKAITDFTKIAARFAEQQSA